MVEGGLGRRDGREQRVRSGSGRRDGREQRVGSGLGRRDGREQRVSRGSGRRDGREQRAESEVESSSRVLEQRVRSRAPRVFCFGKWFTEIFSVNRFPFFPSRFTVKYKRFSIDFYFTS